MKLITYLFYFSKLLLTLHILVVQIEYIRNCELYIFVAVHIVFIFLCLTFYSSLRNFNLGNSVISNWYPGSGSDVLKIKSLSIVTLNKQSYIGNILYLMTERYLFFFEIMIFWHTRPSWVKINRSNLLFISFAHVNLVIIQLFS